MDDKNKLSDRELNSINKTNKKISSNISKLLDQMNLTVNGINRTDKSEILDKQFSDLLREELNDLNQTSSGDVTSFITDLVSGMNKQRASLSKDIETLFNTEDGQLEAYISEQYKNRLIKQADLHEISSQLIELREAINITRDSIIKADAGDGTMLRNITVDDPSLTKEFETYKDAIENVEEKFKLKDKTKKFIVPRTLEYGDYYGYVIPYSDIFNNFYNKKGENMKYVGYESTTLYESTTEEERNLFKKNLVDNAKETKFYKDALNDQSASNIDKSIKDNADTLLKNISVNNNPVPLFVLEEGVETVNEYYKEFIESSNDFGNHFTEDRRSRFVKVMRSIDGTGIHDETTTKSKKNQFKDIRDCYVKLIDPMHMLPVKIMNETIGYYYVQEEDVKPLSGVLTSTIYYNRYDENMRNDTVIQMITDKIVSSFDKRFLKNNIKFKKLIAESINYFNLNNKRVKYQFIPKEYVVEFKVNEDENGNGVSIIEPSLFYAKLYLMILLFKIMSIVTNSNDTKINYIKQSGIEKNVVNKIQEIARKKQKRTINMTDMFSYTSMINKVGAGNEVYIPVGKSGERGIETEVIGGQDIQINSDLLEMLKKAYIMGTGVPDVLMNYFNEADFAKTLELANARFQDRVVSYQIDFNGSITEFYRRILRYSTNIPRDIIDSLKFSFQPPKYSNANVTNELLSNFNTLKEFMLSLYFTDDQIQDPKYTEIVRTFVKELIKDKLPMLNIEGVDKIYKKCMVEGGLSLHKPDEESDGNSDDEYNDDANEEPPTSDEEPDTNQPTDYTT